MQEVAKGVWQIGFGPRLAFNAYLAGDVLIDALPPPASRVLLAALEGHAVACHALTHAHPDHAGGSRAASMALGLPVMCGAADRHAAETGDPVTGNSRISPLMKLLPGPARRVPPVPVAATLSEGERLGDFRVLETPGHTMGHLAFFREADRVLILGDAAMNLRLPFLSPGLRLPLGPPTEDMAEARRSLRRLAGLKPALICFGHGPVLREDGRFAAFVAGL